MIKKTSLAPLLKTMSAVLFLALISALLFALPIADAMVFGGMIEYGFTEITQALLLLACALLSLYLALRIPDERQASLAFSGLLWAMLMRENDMLFSDLFYDGFWLYPALAFSIVFMGSALVKGIEPFGKSCLKICHNRQFGFLIASILLIFVFARLIGSGFIWRFMAKGLLTAEQISPLKRLTEETSELFSYFLLLVGIILRTYDFRCTDRAKSSTALSEP